MAHSKNGEFPNQLILPRVVECMKRGPQPKKVFDAAQCRVRAAKIRALAVVMGNPAMRAGMERLAVTLEQRGGARDAGWNSRRPDLDLIYLCVPVAGGSLVTRRLRTRLRASLSRREDYRGDSPAGP
jgi:hypothetical protein